MAEKFRRRNYFIKPHIQGQFILKIFVLMLFCCVLYAVIFANLSTDSMTITYKDSNLMLGKTPIILFREMLKAQGAFIISGGIGVVIYALIISHRFAGPLYKLELCVKLMLEGDHAFTIELRPNDKGHELAEVINLYNDKVSKEISEMRETTAALGEKLAQCDASKSDVPHTRISEALLLVNQLQDKLKYYKINS